MAFTVDSVPVSQAQFDAQAKFILYTSATVAAGDVTGFTTDTLLQAWLASLGGRYVADYQELQGLRARALSSTANDDLVCEVHRFEVTDAIQRCYRALGRHGKSASDIATLLGNYDPVLGPPGNTAWLYNQPNYKGRCVSLSGGWAYPNLNHFDFEDKASAVVVSTATILFEDRNYNKNNPNAKWVILFNPPAVPDLGDFNNKASSAIVL